MQCLSLAIYYGAQMVTQAQDVTETQDQQTVASIAADYGIQLDNFTKALFDTATWVEP